MLSSGQTIVACLAAASAYVGSLYVFVPAAVRCLPRDDPKHIRYRMAAAMFMSTALLALLSFCYSSLAPDSALQHVRIGRALGIPADVYTWFAAASSTVLLMAVFYAGPLLSFALYVSVCAANEVSHRGTCSALEASCPRKSVAAVCKEFLVAQAMHARAAPEMQLRALVVAPLSEETVFRAITIVIMALGCSPSPGSDVGATAAAGMDPWSTALYCPLWFAVAHAHHAATRWGEVLQAAGPGGSQSKQRLFLLQVVVPTLVQLTYTTIFGYIATLLFLRTGTLVAPVLSHVICNYAQLPNVSFLTAPGSASAQEYSSLHSYRWLLLAVHAAGLVGFALLVLPTTESMSSSSPYWP